MKVYTDYPFTSLGDIAGQAAPMREVSIISYDGNKYCNILVEGKNEELKAGYLYIREYVQVPTHILDEFIL